VTLSTAPVKDPKRVRAGVIGAQHRWGKHGRICRLDQLDPVTRGIFEAILTAQANAKLAAEKVGSA
jgi:hypothetical protein